MGIKDEKFLVVKRDGKLPVVKPDGRKKSHSNRAKHLKYMRIKPLTCNGGCPYASVQAGGDGVCTEYKPLVDDKDSICTVRKDLGTISRELDTRDPDLLRSRVDLMVTSLTEEVSFHMKMCASANMPPNKDLIAAFNATMNGMKIMSEIQKKLVTREVTETETLTNNEITQISRTIREQRNEATD